MKHLYITGDTHGGLDMSKLNSRHFKAQDLTKDDILVILGDAGFVWCDCGTERFWRKFLDNKPWTTFCVLGNHENYDEIEKLPIVEFCGAPAYKVSDSIYYAMTGKVYTICGKKCLVVNGADSHDIYNEDGSLYRKPHISWWEQEKITQEDVDVALVNLAKHNDKVDFVFSHTGGSEVCKLLGYTPTPSDYNLDQVLNVATYNRHFCGHYHIDKFCGGADRKAASRILYDDVMLIAMEDENDSY